MFLLRKTDGEKDRKSRLNVGKCALIPLQYCDEGVKGDIENQRKVCNMKRSAFANGVVWSLIYGGTGAAQAGVLTALVAAGLITRVQSHTLTKCALNIMPRLRDEAWEHYKRTGNVWEALQKFM